MATVTKTITYQRSNYKSIGWPIHMFPYDVDYHLPLVRLEPRDYRYQGDRQNSFSGHQVKFHHQVNNLAENGFYYCGSKDRIRCFSCRLGLNDLSNLDPLVEHIKFSPNCRHVHEQLSRVQDSRDIIQELRSYSPCLKEDTQGHLNGEYFVSIDNYDLDKRRVTFNQLGFRHTGSVLDKFADNGYYYTGFENIASCVFCNQRKNVTVENEVKTFKHKSWCLLRMKHKGD